jgi:hypothetical protein
MHSSFAAKYCEHRSGCTRNEACGSYQADAAKEGLFAADAGGRRNPHRHFINPMIFAMAGDDGEFDAIANALKNDPAAPSATKRAEASMFPKSERKPEGPEAA